MTGSRATRPTTRLLLILILVAAASITAFAGAQADAATEEQLLTHVAAGGSQTLPAGTVVLTQPLVVVRDLQLTGAGPADTTIHYVGSGAAVRVEGGATLDLSNLRIDARPQEDDAPGADLIQVVDGDLLLDTVYLSNARNGAPDEHKQYGYGAALYLTGTATATVNLSFFQRNGLVAVEANGSASVTITESRFDHNVHGVYVEDDVTLTIDATDFLVTEETAVNVRDRATATITRSFFSANGIDPATGRGTFDALRFGGSSRVTLGGNRIEGSPRYALSLFESAEVRAQGNLYTGNGGHDEEVNVFRSAVLLEDSSRYVGSGDAFVENPGGAFELDGSTAMLLESATFKDNASYATGWLSGTANVVLIEATFDGNQGGLWLVGEATLFLERGTFTATGRDVVDARGTSKVTVVEAEFSSNQGAGVYASESATASVLRSAFTANFAGAVASGTAKMEVSGSTFAQNQGAGVLFLADAAGSVSASTFEANGGLAIDLRTSATVAVEANEER